MTEKTNLGAFSNVFPVLAVEYPKELHSVGVAQAAWLHRSILLL